MKQHVYVNKENQLFFCNSRQLFCIDSTLYHGVRLRQRVHAVVISRNQAVKWNACL